MRGVHSLLQRLGAQGGMKRELSTSRFLAFNLLSPTIFGTVLQYFTMFCNVLQCFAGPAEHFSLSCNRVSIPKTSWRYRRPPRSWWRRWDDAKVERDLVSHHLAQVINPYAKEWEAERIFPAHKVFKKFGEAGLLGIHRSRILIQTIAGRNLPALINAPL